MKKLTLKQQAELFKFLVDVLTDAEELTRRPNGKTEEAVKHCISYHQGKKDVLREIIAFVRGA